MMKFVGAAFLAVAYFATPALSWGKMGHTIVGSIADSLIAKQPSVVSAVKGLLQDDQGKSLGDVASWADVVKRQKGYAGWSGPLHFVNPVDDPPKKCGYVDNEANCPGGRCVVHAINNYTSRLAPNSDLSKFQQTEALKFLVHFIGDIHQPLHDTGRNQGGNQDDALWEGRQTNLHSIWDTGIIEKRVAEDFNNNPDNYINNLIKRINSGWDGQAAAWSKCSTTSRPNRLLAAACPVDWANEGNLLDCSVVYPEYEADVDLTADYYADIKAKQYPDVLLARAGVRLANTLGAIFA